MLGARLQCSATIMTKKPIGKIYQPIFHVSFDAFTLISHTQYAFKIVFIYLSLKHVSVSAD